MNSKFQKLLFHIQDDFLDVKSLLSFAILNRLFLLVIGYVSFGSSANKNFGGDWKFSLQYFVDLSKTANYGDIISYLYIADHGYTVKPFELGSQANWAFYPMWPIVMRLGSFVTGGNTLVAVLILTNVCFLVSIVYLYKLIKIDFSEGIAYLATLLAIIFPSSYFYLRPGPESLFLLLNILALFLAKKEQWVSAGLCAGLSAVTRLQGVLVLLPLLFIYLQQYRHRKIHNLQALSLLSIPIFFGLFLFHMYVITGNFLASFAIQKMWDSSLSIPFKAMVQFVLSPKLISYYGWDLSPVNFLFMVLATALMVAIARRPKFPTEYVIYTALHVLLIISRNNLQGSLRFMLPIFPLYIAIAFFIEHRKNWYNAIFYGFIALQTAYFIAFVNYYHFAHT